MTTSSNFSHPYALLKIRYRKGNPEDYQYWPQTINSVEEFARYLERTTALGITVVSLEMFESLHEREIRQIEQERLEAQYRNRRLLASFAQEQGRPAVIDLR